MKIKDLITKNTCTNTINGWVWYCDACDTHGNANSSDEAEFMAERHARYFSWLDDGAETSVDDEVMSYMDYDPYERDNPSLDWQDECLHATYLINVTKAITYGYGEDYSDETPNVIVDLDVALKLQKRLGLQ